MLINIVLNSFDCCSPKIILINIKKQVNANICKPLMAHYCMKCGKRKTNIATNVYMFMKSFVQLNINEVENVIMLSVCT